MATYNPKITLSSAPGITGYLYMVLYEATSPTVPVANSGQLAPPHGSSRQITFTGLNPVIHIVKLFETDGVSTTGTIRANFEIDPQFPGVEMRADLFIYAGVTSGFAVGDNKYVDPADSLDGWDYSLEIPNYGTLDPDQEYTRDSVNNPVIGLPDYVSGDNEKWVIKFQPKAITYNPTVNNSTTNLFSGEKVITADLALTNGDVGNVFSLESATSTLVVTLPDISSVSTRKILPFLSEGGSHINAVLECYGSDKIKWKGDELSQVVLGQSELIWLYKWVNPDHPDDTKWKVLNADTGCRVVGEKVYLDEIPDPDDEKWRNCVFADGSELSREVYPRLWEYVQQLDASSLVSDSTWNTADGDGNYIHRGKYSTGDGSTTFRVPKLFDTGFLRGVDGSLRVANSWQESANLAHGHGVYTTGNQSGVDPGRALQRASTNGDGYGDGVGSQPYIEVVGETEARPLNTGQYILIRA
jgi:hypothetical protein